MGNTFSKRVFQTGPERFKIRNEGTVDDFASILWMNNLAIYLMSHGYGLDTVNWSLWCCLGVENVPKAHPESLLPSEKQLPRLKNLEMVARLVISGCFDTYNTAWGW